MLSCRVFSGAIRRDRRISSFSSLVLGEARKAELQDYDELSREEGEKGEDREKIVGIGTEERTIFSFPKGAGAGTFMHEILEEYPFAGEEGGALGKLVRTKLRAHGFEESWAGVIEKMVGNVLNCPLEFESGSFTLRDVDPGRRLNELEFYFPLRALDEERLEAVLGPIFQYDHLTGAESGLEGEGKKNGGDDAGGVQPRGHLGYGEAGSALTYSSAPFWRERLRPEPVSGFMKGFIDLVFEHQGRYYIVDWKSNHLGDRLEDYGPAALKRSMDENLYALQYHLYTAAVHRYLQKRVRGYHYDAHFGGVIYLFLRGIDPAVGSRFGVFLDRPSKRKIEALCEGLMGEGPHRV